MIAGQSFRSVGSEKSVSIGLLGGIEDPVTGRMIKRLRSDSTCSDIGLNGGVNSTTSGANSSNSGNNNSRPRILVCAPSNTAVDELVYRILTQVNLSLHYILLYLMTSDGI